MASQTRKVYIGISLTIVLSLAAVLLAPPPMVPGQSFIIEDLGETVLPAADLSSLPQSLIDEAQDLAKELFGFSSQLENEFVAELLATYQAARNKDVVIIFNTGGFGWDAISETEEGQGFIDGIRAELTGFGLDALFLNFRRTAHTLNGSISEFLVAANIYPTKAKDLAARVKFLTDHLPEIKIILGGVSNGTLMCDDVLEILDGTRQVYSFQLGPPFWNDAASTDQTLVLRSNGIIPDSFSQGDFVTMLRANIEALFGQSQHYPGNILLYIGAPGHDYQWQYPKVQSQIIDFLHGSIYRD